MVRDHDGKGPKQVKVWGLPILVWLKPLVRKGFWVVEWWVMLVIGMYTILLFLNSPFAETDTKRWWSNWLNPLQDKGYGRI